MRLKSIALPAVLLTAAAVMALSGQTPSRGGPQRIAGGPFEASAVVSVAGGRGVLVADDDNYTELIWMALDERGRQQGRTERVPMGTTLVDPEGMTSDGVHVYVVGSQSKPNGAQGDGLMRFTFDAHQRRIVERASVRNLKAFLAARVPELSGVNPNRGTDEELNIEGLAWDPAASRLLLGLRAPVVNGEALVIPLKLRDPEGPFAADNLAVDGGAIRLPLGGGGIRSLEYDAASGAFWVITGASLNDEIEDFRLLEWRTVAGKHQFAEVARYPRRLKPEGITRATLDQARPRVIVFDIGLYTSID